MVTLDQTAASDLFRNPPDRMIDAEVGAVAIRTVGRGPEVLFVHGWPVHGATFRRLLPYLADHVTCHVVDLPGAGSSRYAADDPLSIDTHIAAVRATIDALGSDALAVVGHDSGGLIVRHAVAGDDRVRAVGLIDTEPEQLGWRFRSFIAMRHLPGFGAALGWLAGRPKLRRNGFVLGDAFVDRDLLDGEFDEFFLRPLNQDPAAIRAGMSILKSFDFGHVDALAELHPTIDVPVQLVWGTEDKFFPIDAARAMVGSFADARLAEIEGAGLFSHEEKPAEVAAALLPLLRGD